MLTFIYLWSSYWKLFLKLWVEHVVFVFQCLSASAELVLKVNIAKSMFLKIIHIVQMNAFSIIYSFYDTTKQVLDHAC